MGVEAIKILDDYTVEKAEKSPYGSAYILPEPVFAGFEGDMRTVNGFFIFNLGQVAQVALLPLGNINPYVPILGNWIYVLQQFVSDKYNQADLPDSVTCAQSLIDQLMSLVKHQMHTQQSRDMVGQTLTQFRTLLSSELGKVHTVVLEEKRAYSVTALWRNPLKVIAPDMLLLLSEFVKSNIEEAAKCLVLDRFTAVGFHAMRSVERVARKYYELITGESPPYTNKKGKAYFKMLGGITQELLDKYDSLQQKKTTSGNLGIIAPTLKGLCKIYRDPLSHPEIQKLDEESAITTFNQAIEAVSLMVLDAKTGGTHFIKAWVPEDPF